MSIKTPKKISPFIKAASEQEYYSTSNATDSTEQNNANEEDVKCVWRYPTFKNEIN